MRTGSISVVPRGSVRLTAPWCEGSRGGWEVDSGEEVGGGGVEVVEGGDAVEGERVGGNFAVEKLSEVTVEGAVGIHIQIISTIVYLSALLVV